MTKFEEIMGFTVESFVSEGLKGYSDYFTRLLNSSDKSGYTVFTFDCATLCRKLHECLLEQHDYLLFQALKAERLRIAEELKEVRRNYNVHDSNAGDIAFHNRIDSIINELEA